MTTIILDPGHGGSREVGGSSPNNATGPTGLKEKEVTLKVAIAAERALAGPDRSVILTREDDRNVGIVARAAVAKQAGAVVFVSIHFNAPGGTTPAQGTETWIGEGHSASSAHLARAVQRKVVAATGYRDRGVKVANVSGVIKPSNHDPRTAHCLVEISFLSLQPDEERRLRKKDYIDRLGLAVADGILDFLGAGALGAEMLEADDAASARRLGLLGDEEVLQLPDEEHEDQEVIAAETGEEEAFGVPFTELDAFERLTELAPDADAQAGVMGEVAEGIAAAVIRFGSGAKEADVTAHSLNVLSDVMQRAGLTSVTISSTSRGPADQARVMYNNLERFGIAHQKRLYGPAGDQVIDVYGRAKAGGDSPGEIKAKMEREIIRIGPTRVSRHASDPHILNVFDVAPSSVVRRPAFERELLAESRIAKTIFPPDDPGYHLEIPQPG